MRPTLQKRPAKHAKRREKLKGKTFRVLSRVSRAINPMGTIVNRVQTAGDIAERLCVELSPYRFKAVECAKLKTQNSKPKTFLGIPQRMSYPLCDYAKTNPKI